MHNINFFGSPIATHQYGMCRDGKIISGPFSTLQSVAASWCRNPDQRGDVCRIVAGKPAALSEDEAETLKSLVQFPDLTASQKFLMRANLVQLNFFLQNRARKNAKINAEWHALKILELTEEILWPQH